MRSEKAPDSTDGSPYLGLMILDVLSGNVGKELLVLVFVSRKNEGALVAVSLVEAAAAKIQTELEGHVEPRISSSGVRRRTREIVD